MSFSIILPFLRPIEQFILDDEIREIMINPDGTVFVEGPAGMMAAPNVRLDRKHVEIAAKNIARRLGNDISESKPILDSRLPDGSRVAALMSPCSVGGTTLTIRKFRGRWFSLTDLVANQTLTGDQFEMLETAVQKRRNVLISGGTGSGKTTLLNALANRFGDEDRVIVIEETMEIELSKPNVIRWESRRACDDIPAVTPRDLVRASLRHRPDRLLVGEVRGGEAFDLLQALNTGHAGSISTLHANSATNALTRLTNCVLEAGVGLPYPAIRANIAACIDLIVHMERRGTRRVVDEIATVAGYDHSSDTFHAELPDSTTSPKAPAATRRPMNSVRSRFGA